MKIEFTSLYEIKEFILMVDLYQLCKDQDEWGGKGYRITNREYDREAKEDLTVTEPYQSKVLDLGHTIDIVTPYPKQISWLFKTLFHYVEYGNELDAGTFLDNFKILCKGYFIINRDYLPQELMLYILDGMKRMVDINREHKDCE